MDFILFSPFHRRRDLALLATCRRLRAEAGDVYFGANEFRFIAEQELRIWLDVNGPLQRVMLRRVCICGLEALETFYVITYMRAVHRYLATYNVALSAGVLRAREGGRKWVSLEGLEARHCTGDLDERTSMDEEDEEQLRQM